MEEIRLKSPAYSKIKYPKPVKIDVVQKKLLDDDTAMLLYYVSYKNTECGIGNVEVGKRNVYGDNAYLVLVKKSEAKVVELLNSEKLNQK